MNALSLELDPGRVGRRRITALVVLCICFVILTAVIAVFLAVFMRSDASGRTRLLWVMFTIILFMYSCSFANFVLGIWMFRSSGKPPSQPGVLASSALLFINIFLSDCIVVWRAWILWKRSKTVLLGSVSLLACATVLFVLSAVNSSGETMLIDDTPLELSLCFAASIAVNLYTTILVGIRTWQCWYAIRNSRRCPLSFKIIILLVESGALYFALNVIFFLAGFDFTGSLHTVGFSLMLAMPYIAAIYPAVIFIFVGKHRSAKDEVFTGDVCESTRGGPTTILDVEIEAETKDYAMSTFTKASESALDREKARNRS